MKAWKMEPMTEEQVTATSLMFGVIVGLLVYIAVFVSTTIPIEPVHVVVETPTPEARP